MLLWLPCRVQHSAAAAVARFSAAVNVAPRSSAAARTPTKQSPAAVVSTGIIARAGMTATPARGRGLQTIPAQSANDRDAETVAKRRGAIGATEMLREPCALGFD